MMNSNEQILENTKRYVPLRIEEQNVFTAFVKTKRIKKWQFIVQPGFVC